MATYPANWKDLATACKQRAGWRCEECGATEHLGAAHVNHDPENPDPELRCLCWPCHRRYDVATGANHAGKNARRLATRRKNQLGREQAERESEAELNWERKASLRRRSKAQRERRVQPAPSGLEVMRQRIRNENEWGW